MFGNFDLAARFVQLCRSSLVVILIVVAVAGAEIELRQNTDGDSSSGSEITAKYPYLVGLTVGGIDEKTNREAAICTGTLLSRMLVLSSAFCMSSLTTMIRESPDVTKLFAYWKTSNNSVKYHRATSVYTHPLYDNATRMFDLSLIKLKKPFKDIKRFVKPSIKTLNKDAELRCVIVGIGAPHERSYKVPVRVKYGPTACRNPKSKTTWEDFLCAEMVGPTATRLPCDRADPLVCGRQQYGIFSYGYDDIDASQATECGNPAIQGRLLFINRYARWIAEMMANHDGDSKQIDEDKKTTTITTKRRRPTRPRPTATSTPEVSSTDQLEINYPYLVTLEGLYDEPVCGGTLLSPQHVLTTAYCTTRMTDIMVIVTTCRRQREIASLVYIHPDFDTYTLTADISIVVLREPLNVIRYVRLPDIISGPTDGDNNDTTTKALDCAVVTASRRLTPYHYVPVNVKYGPKACQQSSDSEVQTAVNKTWREFTCGTLNRQFLNDTGDPLICDGFQYGIISHTYRTSILAAETESAGQVRFVVVDHHREWIDHVITADIQLDSSDGRRNASPGLVVILVVMTAVFRLLSQFR